MDTTDKVAKYMNNEFDNFIEYIGEFNITNEQRKTLIGYINDLLCLKSRFVNNYQLHERLLNAAINDLHNSAQYPSCTFCAHYKKNYPYNHPCNKCDFTSHWEWRGLCRENMKDENERDD